MNDYVDAGLDSFAGAGNKQLSADRTNLYVGL